MTQPYYVYILRCQDASYYTGLTLNLKKRLHEHQEGLDPSAYTFLRRPVQLVWCRRFPDKGQALERERQIKGWSRAKKEALIAEDWAELQKLSRGGS